MDELVNNLVYLLPIALFIAVRLIGVKQTSDRKKQQKESTGKLIEKVQEARKNPDYAKALTRATEVYIPPSRKLTQNSDPAKNKTQKKPKPASPQGGYVNPFQKPDEELAKTDQDLGGPAAKTSAARNGGSSPAQNIPGIFPGELSPLQQALVWSEILGPPKSEQDFPFV
ncbi:MAG: hypothetical protein LBE02_01880 [Spirochaetaceae bacterium]|nr:hypothetical protein [Spirochaetaceae bacterium]